MRRLGWMLMGLPWLTTASMKRGFARRNWHARVYLLGARLHNGRADETPTD